MPIQIPWTIAETTALLNLCGVSDGVHFLQYHATTVAFKLNKLFPTRHQAFTKSAVIAKLSRFNNAKQRS